MALLETDSLTAYYGSFQALFGVDFALDAGEVVAVVGANGAGKSTLMRSLSGALRNAAEQVRFDGEAIGNLAAPDVMARGIAMVPEGRKLFPSLTVEENLLVGRYGRAVDGPWGLDTVYGLFPMLAERRKAPSTALSGGQQQMVAVGRALMSNPRVLLCDEISLGLAPIVVRDIYAAFPRILAAGASIVIVEQDIGQALKAADRLYCLMEGRVSLTGTPSSVTREAIHAAYFGAPPS
ncbi:MAG: ABC transporter ATP-binding protein [Reyranella sp.]|uniref:ABC transporter ATP-binding protein n=1 Tax=Reyranella sp. TaxID=1929291 RepID=UPI0025CBA53D|nr:ABC transporter ATP-binding protein [Reyranella sp.]MBR2815394.1 ABC transporter ATP-binding protein [Reyranella sp.]